MYFYAIYILLLIMGLFIPYYKIFYGKDNGG